MSLSRYILRSDRVSGAPGLFSCIVLCGLATLGLDARAQAPDVVFLHGNILTGSHLVPDQPDVSPTPPRVSAIAIRAGVIVAVGTDAAIARLQSPQTRVVDLNGAFAMPGFNDAHVHLWSAGAQKALSVDLDGTHSLPEMLTRIRSSIAHGPASSGSSPPASGNTWIQGAGWDHTAWPGQSLPTRADLDAVTAGHPAIFYRTDGHILVANSAALAAARITASTSDPAGGKIDRDSAGTPTGILREIPAMKLIEAVIPPPSLEARVRALTVAIDDALAHGVTSVGDYSPDFDCFGTLESMERSGKLNLRIGEWLDFSLPLKELEKRRASHPAGDLMLRYTMLKGFMDGSLGSRTAALAAPYSDDAGNSGIPRYRQEDLGRMAAERASAGFQLGFHAIGDLANHMALEAFAGAERAGHPAGTLKSEANSSPAPAAFRLRIEHAQVLLPGDFDRFKALGVIASMQPSHLLTDMNWAGARLGPRRSANAYAWHTFLTHGIVLAFGTDYPVESVNPFRGLYAATTRENEAGTETFQPGEKISIQQALYAYTQGSAFASFREHELGRLEPGFLADLVVLDTDPMASEPQALLHTRVLRTVVAGHTVYTAPSGPSAH